MKSSALFASALLLAIAADASASIVINITARQLSSDTLGNVPLAAGTLIQLVNIGDDGFNPIDIGDGTANQLGQWVSGNDSLITAVFIGATSENPNFSGAAFDLSSGADTTPGRLLRLFEFDSGVAAGTKIGIRWFPGLQASNFNSITLAVGQAYGQFTRQSNPQYGLDLWVAPADGGTVTFDNLKTVSASGVDANVVGAATFTVVPEPAAIGLSILGAAGLSMLRRRRA